MYFEDLTLLYYHEGPFDASNWRTPLLAIGWLEHLHPYPESSEQLGVGTVLQDMVALAKVSQTHLNFRGLHRCSICEANGNDKTALLLDSNVNLIIPGAGVVYVAPAGITHYIQQHSYQPPSAFIAAIGSCPEYGTAAFFRALREANHDRDTPLGA